MAGLTKFAVARECPLSDHRNALAFLGDRAPPRGKGMESQEFLAKAPRGVARSTGTLSRQSTEAKLT